MASKKSSKGIGAAPTSFEAGAKLGTSDRGISWEEEPTETGIITRVKRVMFVGGRFDDRDKARVTFTDALGSERIRDLPGRMAEPLAWYTGSLVRITAAGKGKAREYDYTLDRRAVKLSSLPQIESETVDLSKSKGKGKAKLRAAMRPKGKRGAK